MADLRRWRGLTALIGDVVEHGASAIERVHLATAQRPFSVIEKIPLIAEPTQAVHVVHDALVSNAYRQVRFVNRLVGQVVDAALEAFDDAQPAASRGEPDHP